MTTAFDPSLLSTFLAVAHAKSVSAAARQIHLSQPAVTSQIRRLESALGTRLFDRTPEGVLLTPAGRRFQDRANRILMLIEEAAQEVKEKASPTGCLSIAASTTIASHLLPRVIADFTARNPKISVEMEVANTEEVLKRVREGSLPLGLVEGHARAPGIRLELFVQDEIVAVGPVNWVSRVRHAADLLSLPLIWREQGSGTRAVIERALARSGIPRRKLSYSLSLGSTEAIKSAVAAGMGVAFLSRWSIQNELALGHLAVLPIADLRINRGFHWALGSGALRSPVSEFFRFAQERAPSIGPVLAQ